MTDSKIGIPVGSPANSANKNNTQAVEVKSATEKTQAEVEANAKAEEEAELDAPYTAIKKVVISSVRNYSAYRKINMQALGKPKATIGSSVKSVRILMSDKGELAAYYPELIGMSANHPDFVTRVKGYLNNIFFDVNDGDKELNVSFHYNHKRDYLKIQAEEDKILSEYDKVDRSNEAELYKAAVKRDEAITRLEQTKYQYGMPENVAEYIIYRHCLNYPDVAKDEAFINSNSNLRFYIKDIAKEENRKVKLINERRKAIERLVELQASPSKTSAVYIQYCRATGLNISDGLAKTSLEQIDDLMKFASDEPKKFNAIVTDRNLLDKAFIETLITRGELVRSEYNQQINTPDGQFIGANINDAIAYFKNPDNAGLKTKLENKLKLI
jgi:hypothetical protein